MRFSLKTLIVIVTLASIGVSSYLQIVKIRQLRHQTAEIKAQLPYESNDDRIKRRNQEILEPHLRNLQAESSRVQATGERVERIFESLVPEFSKVVPKVDQISVREVPLLRMASGLKKHFVVHVPAGRSCQLKVNVATDRNQPRPISAGYLLPKRNSIPLAIGDNRVKFSFGQKEQRYKIEISVNDGQPLEIGMTQPSSNGYSYSVFDFKNQKDYGVGGAPPKLVSFNPSSCDNRIELILVEQPSVESGEQP